MSFFAVFFEESKLLFRDIAIVLTIFGGVLLYSFLYPQPYVNESVSELPITVVDNDHSAKSRDIIFKLDATPQVDVIRHDMSYKDALDALCANKVKAVMVIPHNLQRDLALGKAPTIALGVDNSYFLIYGGVLEGALKTVMTEAASIKVANLLKGGTPLVGAKTAFSSYALHEMPLFNPYNAYTQYVIPAVFILILQQTMLIGMGILGGGINERIRKKEDGYYCHSSVWKMVLSRYILFGVIFFTHMLYYFGFSFEFFGVSHLADIGELLAFGILFLMASLSLGLFLGTIFTSRELATPAILFSSLPLVFSVGFVWPIEAIPVFVQQLSMLFPSTPAMEGFLKLNQMGADFSMLEKNSVILLLQTVIYTFLGYYIMKKRQKDCYGKV
jgi:ABC-2 type transport system permease protein